MTDKDKVRSVVARFFNVPETSVTEDFIFPAERLHGSVGRATFHAAIKRLAGGDLPRAFNATTFRELFEFVPAPANTNESAKPESGNPPTSLATEVSSPENSCLGIDIEHCEHLPTASDPWTEAFYLENFTPAEIAYCQRQPNPRESFCGLWCAKEAAMKCHTDFFHLRPLELEIKHDAQGKPFLTVLRGGKQETRSNCSVSISHSHDISIAVCAVSASPSRMHVADSTNSLQEPTAPVRNTLAWVAFGLGALNFLLLLLLVLKK
jgi:phosphopantetheine--protein transferase-like protein